MGNNITIATNQPDKKKKVRLLAAKLGYRSVSRYLEARIDEDIERFLTPEDLAALEDDTLPKDSSGRRAEQQVAQE